MSFKCQTAQFVRLTMEIHLRSIPYKDVEIQMDRDRDRQPEIPNKNTEISCAALKSNKFALKLSIWHWNSTDCLPPLWMPPPNRQPRTPCTAPLDMKSAANCQKLLNILHVRVVLSLSIERGEVYTSNQLAKCAGQWAEGGWGRGGNL